MLLSLTHCQCVDTVSTHKYQPILLTTSTALACAAADAVLRVSQGSVSKQLRALLAQGRAREMQELRRQLEEAAVREQEAAVREQHLQSEVAALRAQLAESQEQVESLQQQLEAAHAGQQQ